MDRRTFMRLGSAAAGAALIAQAKQASAQAQHAPPGQPGAPRSAGSIAPSTSGAREPAIAPGQPRVVTPNGSTLPLRVVGGVKVGHLVAEPVMNEFAPGLSAECWGYNGSTPGPTIEAIEGDRLRIYVTNRLPEPTTVHWHGLILPNGMDGVSGLNQAPIPVGETYVYEFTLKYPGTFMYHPHHDEMVQIGLGMGGMFIVHPRQPVGPRVDRDFAMMAGEFRIDVGTQRPDPNEMNDFNVLTFNSKAFPGTQPLLIGRGERVRIRFGNLGPMDHHPVHLHGLNFAVTQTDGGYVPRSAQYPETSVLVAVGTTRVIEFVAEEPGDWAMHCHMTHHVMMQMGHGLPPMIGVDTSALDARMRRILPHYMSMGQTGMGGMGEMKMKIPKNSLPMRGGHGPFSYIDMGGMFTILKVRDDPTAVGADGWYEHPQGTVSMRADPARLAADGIDVKDKAR